MAWHIDSAASQNRSVLLRLTGIPRPFLYSQERNGMSGSESARPCPMGGAVLAAKRSKMESRTRVPAVSSRSLISLISCSTPANPWCAQVSAYTCMVTPKRCSPYGLLQSRMHARTISLAMGLSGVQTSFWMKVPSGLCPAGLPPLPGRKWYGSQTRIFSWLFRFSASKDLCEEEICVAMASLSKRTTPLETASSTYCAAYETMSASSCANPAARAAT